MRKHIAWAAGIGIVICVYGVIDPASGMLPSCPFYTMTDLYCPGCGSQRALHALLHGQFASSLGYNPLFLVALLFVIAEGILLVLAKGRRKISSLASRRYTPVVVLVIVLSFWVLRNLAIAPFHALAP